MQLVASYMAGFVARIRTERGQDLLEYAMLGGLIAAAITIVFGILVGVNGSGIIDEFATGIKNCIDFDEATNCTGGL